MDERRDLVDREELRRRLEENFSRRRLSAALWGVVLTLLDAMPAVEWTRGWTRDEVLAELDADPDAVCDWRDPYNDDWHPMPRYRISEWHPEVRRYDVRVVRVAPAPEWVPLTQLVGRTIAGCTGVVDRDPSALSGEGWRWYDGRKWHPFPEGTLNLETGQVAVQPEAAS